MRYTFNELILILPLINFSSHIIEHASESNEKTSEANFVDKFILQTKQRV